MALLPYHLRCSLRLSRAAENHLVVNWWRWAFVRARCSQLPVERRPLVLKATEFQYFFEEGPTEQVYANTPIAGLGQNQQGKMVEEWAKGVLQKQNPHAEISDPEPGICRDGSRRGAHREEYDFLMGGCRVEIKSSRMAWSSTERLWYVVFSSIKLPYGERAQPAFDDLYLVLLSPKCLHLIKHDLVTGLGTCGKRTGVSGHTIRVRGSRRTNCWEDACDEILEKLCEQGGCSAVHEQPLSDSGFQEILRERVSPAQTAVAGIPMSSMSRERRGNRIQEIGLALDRRLNPQSAFSCTGGSRGTANAPADWVRGMKRVELKSCVLTFDRSNNRWQCCFYCIKPDLFDELWLAIYTSVGIHYYRSKYGNSCSLGFGKAGVATKIDGHQLHFMALAVSLTRWKPLKPLKPRSFPEDVSWSPSWSGRRGLRCTTAAIVFIHFDWKRARGHGPQPFTVKPLHVNDMNETFCTRFRLRG